MGMLMLMTMMIMIWKTNFSSSCNIVDHSLKLVEALVLKRYWYPKKWVMRNNGRGLESKENCFEGDF